MSKNKIRLIIGAMTLALIGLIAFQAYWLGFMMESKKEQFTVQARDAIEQVVRKLEKQELVVLAQRQRLYEKQKKELDLMTEKLASKPKKTSIKQNIELATTDYLGPTNPENLGRNILGNFQNEIPSDNIMYVKKSFVLPNGQIAEITEEYHQLAINSSDIQRKYHEEQQLNQIFESDFKRPNKNQSNKQRRFNKHFKEKSHQLRQLKNEIQSELSKKEIDIKKQQAELLKVKQKTELAKEVFSDFLFKERPIQQRVEPHFIDSLIKVELAQKDIHQAYVFGIAPQKIQSNKDWIYTSSPSLKKYKTLQSDAGIFISSALFPNDLNTSGEFLTLYFPSQNSYIWQAMALNFWGSALLLFIMIICFYVAIMTILKQKKLAKVKNDFINNMTHEFKTPISTISLATQLIQEDPVMIQNDSVQRYLGIIKDENIRLGQQVERVLQAAQMEKEAISLKKKKIDLHTLIRQIVEMNGPLIQSQNGQIELQLNAEKHQFEIDEVHISNVLFNLLDNAIKYKKENPLITISTYNEEQYLFIEIKDQGIGIAKDLQETVFEAFYRVPTGNIHNVKGFGLGLSYVKKIVEAHGGKVSLESKLHQGSTFKISLPIQY
jgi:two-component system phosphate regulon sensor histidine kinase PhoR